MEYTFLNILNKICPPEYFAQLFEMKQSGQLSDHGVREVLKVYLDKAKECYSLCQQVDQIKIK